MIYKKYKYDICTLHSERSGRCTIKLILLSRKNGCICSNRIISKSGEVVKLSPTMTRQEIDSCHFKKEEACRFIKDKIKCPKDKTFILC